MDLTITTFKALPCRTEKFFINGIMARMEDFGNSYDHRREEAEPYCCADMRFEKKAFTDKVLEKYNITEAEYWQVCCELEKVLRVGKCGWCS